MCRSIHNKEILDTCSEDFMYLSCVRFVKQVRALPTPFLPPCSLLSRSRAISAVYDMRQRMATDEALD